MKFLIQRSREASVSIDGRIAGQIDRGFVVLIGACETDSEAAADKLVKKMLGLRIFQDAQGKTNLSMKDAGGSLLLISQFTLYADCKKGNRPSFIKAGDPVKAEALYRYVVEKCRAELERWNEEGSRDYHFTVATGRFGADMQVSLINDGPFTVMLDSAEM